jgi:hypothetical protein
MIEVSTAYEMTTLRLGETDGDVAVARQLTNDWYTEQFTEPEEEQEEQEERFMVANRIWVYDGEENRIWYPSRERRA